MLGHVDGKPFQTEVTLLPETRIIEWEEQQVETLVSQYNAYLGGRIEEVAYDYYAQADDGSVWYFGEDVFDRDEAIVVTEGTWLAGRDGPAAMIMPGDPQVGEVYRTENAPGFVFEEVTVLSVDEQLDGPMGPIDGGLLADELHSDGTIEQKIFARVRGVLHVRRWRRRGPGSRGADRRDLRAGAAGAHGSVGRRARRLRHGRVGGLKAASATRFATWRPPGTPFEAATSGLIEPRMDEALRAHTNRPVPSGHCGRCGDPGRSLELRSPAAMPTRRDRPRADGSVGRAAAGGRGAPATPAGSEADAFALGYVRDRIRAADALRPHRINTDSERSRSP